MARRFTHYVVWKGRKPGVYDSWSECYEQVNGYSGPVYKGFHSRGEAKEALKRDPLIYVRGLPGKNTSQKSHDQLKKEARRRNRYERRAEKRQQRKEAQAVVQRQERLELPCIVVDGSYLGNLDRMEYQAIGLPQNAIIFSDGPYRGGGASIAEFLGLVKGLQYLENRQMDMLIYSDSKTALSWVRRCKVNSVILKRDDCPDQVKEMVQDALGWLRSNTDFTKGRFRKWHTTFWGENPADYGRK
jgi:ribonuclease HI